MVATLVEDMRSFVEAHKSAYGTSLLKPKHHFAIHSALRFEASAGEVLDCFVHERKHQALKAAASKVRNTGTYEASVLGEVLLEQARQLDGLPPERGLVGRAVAHPELGQALGMSPTTQSARNLRCEGLQVGVGDLVLFGSQAGLVQLCGHCEGFLFVVVTLLECLRRDDWSSSWRAKADRGVRVCALVSLLSQALEHRAAFRFERGSIVVQVVAQQVKADTLPRT